MYSVLRAGIILSIRDNRVRPKGRIKWHICVCPRRRLFLRINSRPIWPLWYFLECSKNVFLEHDSYVELNQLFFHHNPESATQIGELTATEARAIAQEAQHARTLSDDHKEIIWDNLSSL